MLDNIDIKDIYKEVKSLKFNKHTVSNDCSRIIELRRLYNSKVSDVIE